MRLTVRTWAGMLATLLILIGFGYSQLPSFLYYNGYQEALLKWFPDSEYAKPAMNSLAYELYGHTGLDGDPYVFVSANGWSASSNDKTPTREQRATVIAKLEELLGNFGSSEQSADVLYHLAQLYFWNEEWEKAEQLFQEVRVMKDISSINENEFNQFLSMLDTRHPKSNTATSLEGRIEIGGKPVPNAFVMIRRADDMSYYSPPFHHYPVAITDEEGRYHFYSQEPGEYVVGVGVRPEQLAGFHLAEADKKQVTIGQGATAQQDFHFVPQIKTVSPASNDVIEGDELAFKWEPYDGAAYYKLFITTVMRGKDGKINGASTAPLSETKHKGTSAVYSIKELREAYSGGMEKSYGSDGVILSATSLLGLLHPGGEFLWSVEAYDTEGRKLSSSAGYYLGEDTKAPHFRISEQGMLEGDRLVLQVRYQEAIEAYERERDNDRALRVLTKLTEQGITEQGGDPAKALAYLEQIKQPTKSDLNEIERLKTELNKR